MSLSTKGSLVMQEENKERRILDAAEALPQAVDSD